MYTLQSVKEFLESKPGYKKKGIKWVANHLGVEPSLVAEAKGAIRANRSDYSSYDKMENETNGHTNRVGKYTAAEDQSREEYCISVGLDPDKIDPYNDVKYWTDSAGRRRYSIVPKDVLEREEEFKNSLLKIIKDVTPKADIKPARVDRSNSAGLINLYDAHFDKISDIGESYTLEDNCNIIREGFSKSLARLSNWNPEVILLPIGNDFFNANDYNNTTKAGTPQGVLAHWKKSFKVGTQLIRELIESASAVTNKVVIVPIEGNHDEDKIFYLNEILKAAYEDSGFVEFEEESAPRHYIKYGSNLLGFGHGKWEKKRVKELPQYMAEEAVEYWSSTKHREFFLGDIHHKRSEERR